MTTKQLTDPHDACAVWAPGHEHQTSAKPRMNPSMKRFPAMMMLVLPLYRNRPYPPLLQPTQWVVQRTEPALLRAGEQRKLQSERRRRTAGGSLTDFDREIRRMGKRDEPKNTEFGLKRYHRTIEHCPGGTHPGTEQGAVCSFLVVGVLRFVRNRLGRRQTADHEDTENQEANEGTLDQSVVHNIHSSRTGGPMVLDCAAESQDRHSPEVCLFQIGFRTCFRYTTRISLGITTVSIAPFCRKQACSHKS